MEKSQASSVRTRQTSYRQIAKGLRDEIISGKLPVGAKCPSTRELASLWKASVFTAHKAMVALSKEGWIEIAHGEGAYVADPATRFVCAGIYQSSDLCATEENGFLRRVHVALLKQFDALEKETLVFMDTRPEHSQGTLLPSLAEAIANRRIQCLIFPTVTTTNSPALSRLTLPTATLSYPFRGRVEFDMENILQACVRAAAAAGCRSVGLMSSMVFETPMGFPWEKFYSIFQDAVRKEGLVTRDEWIRKPDHYILPEEAERYGYAEFKRFWKLREKPEGMIVYPDIVVRGAVTAILDLGRSRVTEQMKFVFHRNEHLSFLCPLPVTWAITDEDRLATGLIQQVQLQLRGEKIMPILLQPIIESSEGEG